MRVWVSNEGRRIPLMIESDLWLGVVRLILTQYDPPHESPAARVYQPPHAASWPRNLVCSVALRGLTILLHSTARPSS
jgi:hypothetical protein